MEDELSARGLESPALSGAHGGVISPALASLLRLTLHALTASPSSHTCRRHALPSHDHAHHHATPGPRRLFQKPARGPARFTRPTRGHSWAGRIPDVNESFRISHALWGKTGLGSIEGSHVGATSAPKRQSLNAQGHASLAFSLVTAETNRRRRQVILASRPARECQT
jgi:hypothetical protein